MKAPPAKPRNVLHFAGDSDTSGFFPQLARWHQRGNYRMLFGTLYPTAPWLEEYMTSQGVPSFSLGCRGRLGFPLAIFRLARLLRKQHVDILHTHLFEPSVVGLVAGKLAGTPMLFLTRHYSDYHTRIHKGWHVRADQLCTALSHRVVAVSRHTAQHLTEVEKTPPAKVRVVYNGIDFDRVKPSGPDARARVRAAEGLREANVVLVAARLHPEKGYEYLLDAIPVLREKSKKPLVLLVAGRGPFEAAYRERTRRLGCEEVVRFLGFRRDLPDLMVASDVFVLPSVAEAFGLVVVEALYLGVPVVATRVGGIPEIVEEDTDGLLVPPANSEALVCALERLLADPEERARLTTTGRARVTARFGFERMVREYEALYEELDVAHPGSYVPFHGA
jgi:glycosyltransferase involved in cell wall biosynthesis